MKDLININNIKTILIAPDKFKGSLTATEFCDIAKETILRLNKNINVICCPLADGGEGSLDCFINATNATIISGTFTGSNYEKISSKYAILNDTAFIELAETSGLVKTHEKNPCITTTFGMGEQIADAIKRNVTTIILSIGGSSTTDAGCGMACALGFKFINFDNKEFIPVGGNLNQIKEIIPPKNMPKNIKFITLCDVNNPLFGKNGAAFIYAKQKGATDEQIELLDKNLEYFNSLCKNFGFDFEQYSGAGAAGGVGAGTVFFLNSKLDNGVKNFFNLTNIDDKIKEADLIITGEGKIDKQTYFGKVVFQLKEKSPNKSLVAFCGENQLKNNPEKIDFPIIEINKPNEDLSESIKHTKINLIESLENFFKKIF